jgi:DNA-directed RNA polymerase specialized sigma24 family protein
MREVAEALSCPLQTAYSRLHAARAKVRACVEAETP